MTLSLRRCTVNFRWFAVCFFIVAFLAPWAVDAQNTSTKARAAPPAKTRPAAKAVRAATPWMPNPAVGSRDSYLVVDAMSGRDLLSDQPDELRHPASLTKLMTLYLTFSALDSGRLSLGDGLVVSITALNAPPTKMGMVPGGTVIVRDAVMGLVTRSANDAVPANNLSSRSRSPTEPTISAAITGGSARTTGICETPYSRITSMASRTVSFGCMCTNSGVGPDLAASTSPTVAALLAEMKP